jgi:hypothetical protein
MCHYLPAGKRIEGLALDRSSTLRELWTASGRSTCLQRLLLVAEQGLRLTRGVAEDPATAVSIHIHIAKLILSLLNCCYTGLKLVFCFM